MECFIIVLFYPSATLIELAADVFFCMVFDLLSFVLGKHLLVLLLTVGQGVLLVIYFSPVVCSFVGFDSKKRPIISLRLRMGVSFFLICFDSGNFGAEGTMGDWKTTCLLTFGFKLAWKVYLPAL